MNVKENFDLIIERYPFSEKYKKSVMDYLELKGDDFYVKSHQTNAKAKMSSYRTNDDIFNPLINFIALILKNKISNINKSNIPIFLQEFWVVNYGVNDSTENHMHGGSTFSFVYFLNSPKGSSPLIFTSSRKKIRAEEGKLVIFPGNINHRVPKNKCDNRIVLCGNILLSTGKVMKKL